jgi:magnesium transporter
MAAENAILEAFAGAHPDGFARILEQAAAPEAAAVLADLGTRRAARVLAEMVPVPAARCVEALEPSQAAALIGALDVDAAAALLRRAAERVQKAVVQALPAARRQALGQLLAHAPESAGALMDPLILAVPQEVTAGEALGRVRADPEHAMYPITQATGSR